MKFIKLRTDNDLILVNPESVTKIRGGIEGDNFTITLVDGVIYRINCNIIKFVDNLACKESGKPYTDGWSAHRIIE